MDWTSGGSSTGLTPRRGRTAELPEPAGEGGIRATLPVPLEETRQIASPPSDVIGIGLSSLDSPTHNRNSILPDGFQKRRCGYATLSRIGQEAGAATFDWFRVRCKAWHCETCGSKKAVRLRKAIEARASELGLSRFLTLTLDPSKLQAGTDPVQHLRGHVWAKFRTYLKRKYGRAIQYIAVLEFTEAGVPHLHVLVDRFIPQAWISETWDALGGGRVVDIRRVYDMHRMARYVSKYLTKQVILSAPRGVRRWSVSRGIHLFEKKEKGTGWSFINASFDAIHRRAQAIVTVESHDAAGLLTHFTTNGDALGI